MNHCDYCYVGPLHGNVYGLLAPPPRAIAVRNATGAACEWHVWKLWSHTATNKRERLI